MRLSVIILAAFLLAMNAARTHEWFPVECCGGDPVTGDCKPLTPNRVWALADGSYLIDGRFHVPAAEVRASLDGRFYGCIPKPDVLRCFFAPPRGM